MGDNIKNLQDMIDDIKTKITDNEYKNLSDNVQKIFNEKTKEIYKVYLYYPHITTNVCSDCECNNLKTYNILEIKEISFLTSINDDANEHPIFSKLLNNLKNNVLVKCGQYIQQLFDYVPLEFKTNDDYVFTNTTDEDTSQNIVFNVDTIIDNVLIKMVKI